MRFIHGCRGGNGHTVIVGWGGGVKMPGGEHYDSQSHHDGDETKDFFFLGSKGDGQGLSPVRQPFHKGGYYIYLEPMGATFLKSGRASNPLKIGFSHLKHSRAFPNVYINENEGKIRPAPKGALPSATRN